MGLLLRLFNLGPAELHFTLPGGVREDCDYGLPGKVEDSSAILPAWGVLVLRG
jgi:hypothetical protein